MWKKLTIGSFIFLNSLKITFIDNFIITSTFNILSDKIVLYKILLYLFLNLIIFIWLIRLRNKWFLVFFYIVQSLYLFIHFAYFLYFSDIFHIRQVVWQFQEGIWLLKNFMIPKDIKYIIILIDAPLFLLIMLNFSKLHSFLKTGYKIINLRRLFFIFSALFFLPFFFTSQAPVNINKLSQGDIASEKDTVWKHGAVFNDIIDIVSFKYHSILMNGIVSGKIIVFNSAHAQGPKNIICFQVESLDANIIDAQYKGNYVMPFLHNLSLKCVYYPYMLYYRCLGGTSDTEFAAINSAVPPLKAPFYTFRGYDYPNSFVKVLSAAGFNTLAFHNNIGSFYNRNRTFANMGFDKFHNREIMDVGSVDSDLMKYIKNILRQQKTPFFYYIINMSSHEPYIFIRSYYLDEHYEDIREESVRNYFNAMHYMDNVLEDMVVFIKKEVPNTYIFIYGDHEAHIKNSNIFKSAGDSVPLLITTPDNRHYVENNKIASMLDLAPTILYASGVDFEIQTEGVDLLDYPIKESLVRLKDRQIGNRRTLFKKNKKD